MKYIMDNAKYTVSATPHIRSAESIDRIMKHVVIALMPAVIISLYYFGIRGLFIYAVSILACIGFEALYRKIIKRPSTIGDFSAVVTGLLLAMNLPVSVPLWIPVVGSFFAIVIVKQLFGGLGQNFMNPALGARAFLLSAYPTAMTSWTEPVRDLLSVDMVSTATPLAVLESNYVPGTEDLINVFLGNTGGCLGETSAIALLVGGFYLLYKKVINWRIPGIYILTVFGLSYIFGRNGFFTGEPVYEIFVGGLMLGSIFMATDYSSSPVTPKGQIIYAAGCGILTTIIRVYGGYPEGVSYSILFMSLTVPLLDKYTKPRVFGVGKKGAGQK